MKAQNKKKNFSETLPRELQSPFRWISFTSLAAVVMQLQQGKNHCQPHHLSGWVMVCICKYVLPHTFILSSYSSRPQRSAHLNLQNTILNQMRDGMRDKTWEYENEGEERQKSQDWLR